MYKIKLYYNIIDNNPSIILKKFIQEIFRDNIGIEELSKKLHEITNANNTSIDEIY